MDYFLAGEDHQQTNQPNDLAGGWPLSCTPSNPCVCFSGPGKQWAIFLPACTDSFFI